MILCTRYWAGPGERETPAVEGRERVTICARGNERLSLASFGLPHAIFPPACPGGGMADTKVLEAFAVRCAGSSPVPGTSEYWTFKIVVCVVCL